jgi:uncharacterized protein (DUF305 family)
MKINQFVIATLSALLIFSPLVGQQSQPPQTKNPSTPARQDQALPGQGSPESRGLGQQGDSAVTKEQAFAKFLEIYNQEQVQLARFAKDKVSHDEVKKFVATLEKDHQSGLEKVKEISPQSETDRSAFRTVSTTSSNSPNVDFLQLYQEISTQCLKDTKEMLSGKKGSEFDAHFIGMQIAKHASARSNLTVLQRHATGKLQEQIKSDLETTEKHMEAAINLMEALADSGSPKSAREAN